MTGLSRTIFYGAGDRLEKKMSLYVESYEYVEVYDGVWGVLVSSGVGCYKGRSYDISGAVYRLA